MISRFNHMRCCSGTKLLRCRSHRALFSPSRIPTLLCRFSAICWSVISFRSETNRNLLLCTSLQVWRWTDISWKRNASESFEFWCKVLYLDFVPLAKIPLKVKAFNDLNLRARSKPWHLSWYQLEHRYHRKQQYHSEIFWWGNWLRNWKIFSKPLRHS